MVSAEGGSGEARDAQHRYASTVSISEEHCLESNAVAFVTSGNVSKADYSEIMEKRHLVELRW